jgi:predicted small secreted protein
MITRAIALLFLALIGLSATACDNTIRGVGADAKESGAAIEDSVE